MRQHERGWGEGHQREEVAAARRPRGEQRRGRGREAPRAGLGVRARRPERWRHALHEQGAGVEHLRREEAWRRAQGLVPVRQHHAWPGGREVAERLACS